MTDVYSQIGASQPGLLEGAENLRRYANEKLYHQLVEEAYGVLSEVQNVALAQQVFEKDIQPISAKLNPVRYMQVVGVILRRCFAAGTGKTAEDRLAFVSSNFAPFDILEDKDEDGDVKMGDAGSKKPEAPKKKVGGLSHYSKASESDFQDAKALFLSFKSQILVDAALQTKAFEPAKDVLDELEKELFQKRSPVNIKPTVFSWFYKAQVDLYKALENPSALYRAGVNYLLYTPLERAAKEDFDLCELAVDVGIACLVAEGEYFFGELLDLPLFQQVEEVKALWIYDLVFAFQEGKYELYDQALKKHAATLAKFPVFEKKKAPIYEKFCSSVLLEFAFQQPKSKRKVFLKDLAQHIRVEDVETLLINAMCANLIRGTIDEVEGTFTFTWVQPRVLDVKRLEVLENRVSQWVDQQKAVLKQMEDMTPDLLVTV